MPFTPFHFGPGSLPGFILYKKFYIPSLLIGSIIIDIEPIAVIIFNLDYPLHGYLHTYLGATLMEIATWLLILLFLPTISKFMAIFSLEQETNYKTILSAAFLGTYSHVFLDSFLYAEIHPFFPIFENPFFGVFYSGVVYDFCLICFLPSIFLLLYRINRNKAERKER